MALVALVAAPGCAGRPPPPSGPPPEYERPIVRPWGPAASPSEAAEPGADVDSSADAGDGGTTPAPAPPAED